VLSIDPSQSSRDRVNYHHFIHQEDLAMKRHADVAKMQSTVSLKNGEKLARQFFSYSALVLAFVVPSPGTHAETLYTNNFETAIDPGWSSLTGKTLGINRTPNGQGFLGWAGSTQPLNGVSHEGLMLTTAVPRPGLIKIDFDLYLINSWDGNSSIYGPDIFQMATEGNAPIIRATFANVAGLTQTYPGNLNNGAATINNPSKTGASEINALGYLPFTISGDAVYHFAFVVPVTDGILNFSVQDFSNGAGLPDESWGLDNINVTEVPEPNSLLLFTTALALMQGISIAARRVRSTSSKP
jgi:hypothetical protein